MRYLATATLKGNRIKKNRKKYQDLARKISRTWRAKTKVIPVVVVVLGVIPKNLSGDLKEIGIPNRVRTLQKSALLGAATHKIEKGPLSLWSREGIRVKVENVVISRTKNTCAN